MPNQYTTCCKLREKILKTKYSPGVYFLFNIIDSSKFYVGSSVRVRERLLRHATSLRNNKHDNIILQNSFNKNKDFGIIVHYTQTEAISRHLEQCVLNTGTYYNIAEKAIVPPIVRGEKHHFYDETCYPFNHPEVGTIFCTRVELRNKYKVDASNLKKLIQGKRKVCQGWTLNY